MSDSIRPRTMVIGGVVLALVLVAVVAASASGGSPEDHLRETYEHVRGDDPGDSGGVVFRSDTSSADTADAVATATEADEDREEAGTHYLRYDDDWMVTVTDTFPGSEITLYEFDTGYTQHSSAVVFWGGYYNRGSGGSGFRGGGSGFGK